VYQNIIPDSAVAGRPDLVVTVAGNQYTVKNGVLRYDMAPYFKGYIYSPLPNFQPPIAKGNFFYNIVLSGTPSKKWQDSANQAINAGDLVNAIFYLYAVDTIEKDVLDPVTGLTSAPGHPGGPCYNADQLHDVYYFWIVQAWHNKYDVKIQQDPDLLDIPVYMGGIPPIPDPSLSTAQLEALIPQYADYSIEGTSPLAPYYDSDVFGMIYWSSIYTRAVDINRNQDSSNFLVKVVPYVVDAGIAVFAGLITAGAISAAFTPAVTVAGIAPVVSAPVGLNPALVEAAALGNPAELGIDTGLITSVSAAGEGAVSGGGMSLAQYISYAGKAANAAAMATKNKDLGVLASALGVAGGDLTSVPQDIQSAAGLVNDYNALTYKNPSIPASPYGYGPITNPIQEQVQPDNILLYLAGGVGFLLLLISRRKGHA
jgi:hypothetical protein